MSGVWWMKILLLAFLPLSGCSLLTKDRPQDPPLRVVHAEEKPEEDSASAQGDLYAEGLHFLAKGENEKAIDSLQAFLVAHPVSQYSVAATFHLARAYENLMAWPRAIFHYRRVTVAPSAGIELVARSFYRLSFCYEASAENNKSIASLLDALRRKDHLPFEVAQAEAPARLASAYARLGNEEEAMKFYRQAEAGIQRLRRVHRDPLPAWLPKTLFYMGTMNDLTISPEDFGDEMRPFERAQVYLLQAAELRDEQWSKQASEQLVRIYQALWQAVQEVELPLDENDPVLARRQRQQKQWQMSLSLLDAIADLRRYRLPEEPESQYVVDIFHFIKRYESQVKDFIKEIPEGQGKTPEAAEREGLFRRGRTLGQ